MRINIREGEADTWYFFGSVEFQLLTWQVQVYILNKNTGLLSPTIPGTSPCRFLLGQTSRFHMTPIRFYITLPQTLVTLWYGSTSLKVNTSKQVLPKSWEPQNIWCIDIRKTIFSERFGRIQFRKASILWSPELSNAAQQDFPWKSQANSFALLRSSDLRKQELTCSDIRGWHNRRPPTDISAPRPSTALYRHPLHASRTSSGVLQRPI